MTERCACRDVRCEFTDNADKSVTATRRCTLCGAEFVGKAQLDAIEAELTPILHWFDGDGEIEMPSTSAIVRDLVADIQADRVDALDAARASSLHEDAASALHDYRSAQRRMLASWAEGDAEVKRTLWKNLHACEEKATRVLDMIYAQQQ